MISSRVPATGDGISVSTLSVDTSSSGSSTATGSPTCLSQRVTVPSVTLSPSAGMVTGVPVAGAAGASATGAGAGAGAAAAGAGAWPFCWTGSGSGALSCAGAGAAGAAAPERSAMIASSAPTWTVSSSRTTIFWSVPAAGDGISVSTLSVDTSSSGSSISTDSPSCFNHRVTVPSVTLSPRAGIWTEKAMFS